MSFAEMTMKLFTLAVLVATLSACSSYHKKLVVTCETDSSAFLTDTRECVMFRGYQIETVGNDTVITWMSNGRRVVLRDMAGYTGAFTAPIALFGIGNARVSVTEDHFRLYHPTYRIDADLAKYEKQHLVLDDGVLSAVDRHDV